MKVVFYISGHGFGHASRQVEVINAFAARRPDVRIAIRSSVDPVLLGRTIRTQCTLDPVVCDPGIVQISSIEHDDAATLAAAVEFYRSFEARVRVEIAALADSDVALVVGDIPPLAFATAARLEVPSVAIANFTWDWVYETQPGFDAEPWVRETIREAYAQATLALEPPMSAGFEIFRERRPLPLIARRATRSRADTRRHFGIPLDRPAVLLSFGGYGLPSLDLGGVDCGRDWTVVTTDRVTGDDAMHAHVVRIAEAGRFTAGFRYEDLVAAVDVVLTKPGYGIIAECASTGTAMLYTSRGAFREYDLLVGALPSLVRSRFISQEDLLAGRWRQELEASWQASGPATPPDTSGAERAAAALDELLKGQ